MNDVIIIGKGPAGISAALYTVRANLDTLVLAKDYGQLIKAAKIENYFGFSEPVSGEFLLKEGEKQALRLGACIVDDEVISIEKEDYFKVKTADREYECKALLLASGQSQKKMRIANLDKYEGKGVSYCTTCDGFFFRNLRVGVLGFKDYAVHEAEELEAFTKDITIYTNGNNMQLTEKAAKEASRFKTNKKKLVKVEGDDFLKKIYFEDGSSEDIDGLFIAYESASGVDFARKLGVIIKDNAVVVDSNQQTNLEGVFAAGDCTGGLKQISTAVGEGALAGRRIIEYLKNG
ncbi:MAG: NAD(P)/FAD-dependent oxidoreductase [Acetivibrionales bacterium]|jgi:thioredoxin reductase (NADPH)